MSSDEASRRRYRRLSSATDEQQHDALLAALRYVTLDVARMPVKLVELVEVRKLKVLCVYRGGVRNRNSKRCLRSSLACGETKI